MRRHIGTFLAALATLGIFDCAAQSTPAAIKTNLLYDALLNANLGAEFRLAPHWSLDISGNYNGWSLSHKRQWKHWLVQPEVRWWTREAMNGHFVAGHLIGGQFNTTLADARRQGWGAGVGVGYGYAWHFAKHWGLEAEIAVGYAYLDYDKYPCADCGRKIADRTKHYVGPTKAAVNLVYYFGSKDKKPQPVIEETTPQIPDTVPAIPAPDFRFKLVDVPQSRILSEQLSGTARIHFASNSTEIDTSLANNTAELFSVSSKLDSICNDLGMQVVAVEFIGYASPDGSYANNERLATARVAALSSLLQSECDLPADAITVSSVAEDWQGLRQAVEASELADKQVLLSIIESPLLPDAKEQALRRHTASWNYIKKNIIPELRRTQFRIDYEHRYEERETQTLEQVNQAINAGDAELAATLLVEIPSSPEADYARGLVAALRGNYSEAESWLRRAAARGVAEADDAISQIHEYLTINPIY